MREIVSTFLSNNGFAVAVASDGRDGLAQLRLDPDIRLIVSDINMPNMDGLTMAQKIRTEMGERDVRIVMLTTEDNSAIRARGREVGVTGWIVKPFRGEAVLGPFRRFCGMA
ncbi:response regulator [Rubrivivax pictus]|uniref:Response regulator n=2 Tax=Pseudaquabacterium pictum TaxID=2315236 RepID=A0A480AUL8_9BURK|nr:response regulator [Rubrivivax pictus]